MNGGFFALVRFVSLRHIASSPMRSLLTLLGVALGVAMVVGMTASNESVLHAFDEMVDRASGKADLEVTGDESGVDQGLVDELAARPDLVAHVAGRIEQTSFLEGPSPGQPGERVLILGVDFLGDKEFLPFQTEGGADVIADPLAFLNDPNAILVSDTLAKAEHLSPGSTLRLRTTEGMTDFRVEAVLEETGKTRAFGGQLVVLFLDAAQLAFERRGHVDHVDIALAKGVDVGTAKAALQAIVGKRGSVDRPSKRASQVAQMSKSFQLGLEIQGMIAMLVGMFLIYNSVSVSVAQRKREIGILRSVGVTRRRVAGVFLAEAFVTGGLGGLLGVALGGGLARVVVGQFAPEISRFYENIAPPVPRVTLSLALFGVAVGLVATVLAAWIPARRASHTSPVESLRRDLHATSRARTPVRVLAIVGAVFLAAALLLARVRLVYVGFASLGLILLASACLTPLALVLLGRVFAPIAQRLFGLPARLGIDNVSRELGRSALTTSALMLATSMSVTIASYTNAYEASCMDWIEQSIPADIFVTAGSPLVDRNTVAFSPTLKDALSEVSGIDRIDMVRSLTATSHGLRIEILSLGSEVYLAHVAEKKYRRVLDGPDPPPVDILSREPAVFVSENFSGRTGLHAGDSLELTSPTGAHVFKIAAVVVDYSSDQGWMMMDRRWATLYWQDERVEALDIYLRPGTDPEDAAARIRRRLSASTASTDGLFVTTNASLKGEVRHAIRQTFAVSKSSEIVALAVAVLGIIGTMLAAVIDRIREIGVMRAIGATRRQVLAAVLAEAGFLGLASVIVGVVASIPSTFVFVRVVGYAATGWNVPFRFPAEAVLRVGSSVILFALLAGLLPGWRAARLEITRALAYE